MVASVKFEKMNLPNWLTTFRVALIPVVIACLYQQTNYYDWAAGIIFGIASITDFFDGYLARKWKLETIYGKLIDPLADKFLVVCAAIMLLKLGRIHEIAVMILLCRELAITGLRAIASSEGIVIGASGGGKWKTTIQMFALPFMMVHDPEIPLYKPGEVLLYISLGLSLWSAFAYVLGFFKSLAAKQLKKVRAKKQAKKTS